MAGLIAVVLVMSLAHVALGQTVFGVYRGITEITDRSDDPDAGSEPDGSLDARSSRACCRRFARADADGGSRFDEPHA